MGATTVPLINEIAFFLKKRASETYDRLQSEGPEFAEALTTGYIGGTEAEAEATEESRRAAKRAIDVRARVLAEALGELVRQANGMSQELKRKLATLKRLQFLAGVTAAFASSGVLGFAIAEKHTETIALAVAALLSSVATLASSILVLGTDRKESDLVETLRTLARATTFAELTTRMLTALSAVQDSDEEVRSLIEQANLQFRELTEALSNASA